MRFGARKLGNVLAWSILPESLEVVKAAQWFVKDMNHNLAKIEEYPAATFHPFYRKGRQSDFLFEGGRDALGNRANLASVSAAADEEVVAVGHFPFQLENDEVFGLLFLGDAGSSMRELDWRLNGCLQGAGYGP